MGKTFADMTKEERDDCRGMWCDIIMPTGKGKAVYDPVDYSDLPFFLIPGYDHFAVEDLHAITPCYELPRAWNTDGR